MKQRSFLWVFVSFLLGMGVAYGLIALDRRATAPRLGKTDIFEVVSSDGSVLRLSYEEIERERAELRDLRQQLREETRLTEERRGPAPAPPLPVNNALGRKATPEKADKNLKDLFAKIFSQPIMQDLVQSQVAREAGELAAVLDLSDEQTATLQQELEKRKRRFAPGPAGPRAEAAEERSEPEPSLQESLQSILTPEQYQRYQEYTEKKNALAGAPALDRQIFELNWRLKLTEEEEDSVREILSDQEEKAAQFSPPSPVEADASSPVERLKEQLARRTALNKETADKMKNVLEEDQYQGFLKYQTERDTETRLLERLIREEGEGGSPATQ